MTLLEEHVSLLKTDCEVEDGATEQLKAVRTLIMSLENCPGRNDFRLTIPSESQRAQFEAAEKLQRLARGYISRNNTRVLRRAAKAQAEQIDAFFELAALQERYAEAARTRLTLIESLQQ